MYNKPYREGKHAKFTSSENGCTHVGKNPAKNDIRQFKVDGEVFAKGTAGTRCDYLLLNDTMRRSYYIELKGSDILEAINQIEKTIALMSPSIKEYDIFRRIIYRTGSHKVMDKKVTKWKLKHGTKRAKVENRYYEEVI